MGIEEERLLEIVNKCKSGCVAPSGKEFVMGKGKLEEIIAENGITYCLAQDGCYYSQLSLE